MIMCHMIADSFTELHEMAKRLGLKKAWFQNFGFPHYDICQVKKQKAIKLGAIECDRTAFVTHMRRLRKNGINP